MTESDAGEGNHSCEPSPGMVGPQWQFNRIHRRKRFLIKNTEQVMTELGRLIQSKADVKRVERQLAKCIGSLFSQGNQGKDKIKAKKKLLLPEEKTLVYGDS